MADQPGETQDSGDITVSLGPASPGLQTAYLVISLIVILAANSLLILLVCMKDYLRQPRYYLRCHLAANDIFYTAILIPKHIRDILEDDTLQYRPTCGTERTITDSVMLSTYGVYLLMAIDIYYFICYPLQYRNKITTWRLALGVGLVDTFSFICGTVPLILVGQPDEDISCLMMIRSFPPALAMMVFGIVALVIGVMVIVGLYYIVLKEAKRQQERDEQRPVKFYKTKGFKTMAPHAIVLVVSVVTSVFLAISKNAEPSEVVVIVQQTAILLYLTVSSMLNPIIYSLRLPEFRRALREMCRRAPTAAVAAAVPSRGRARVIEVRAIDSASNVRD
ncbi:OR6C65 [Branchiostoma lanceolatum]|uniref:OR6C65 protein n=1 Tax=Branchiostoma lanceolatum TaxID=7740 RepID=A0A8J9ZCP2_BRALA|nr:OR6C65 [Branchiostoma lanceolatum]